MVPSGARAGKPGVSDEAPPLRAAGSSSAPSGVIVALDAASVPVKLKALPKQTSITDLSLEPWSSRSRGGWSGFLLACELR